MIRPVAIVGVLALAALAWAFAGVERVVGDHESGVTWEPFLKHRPALQLRFDNPAQQGLDLVPLAAMAPDRRAAFQRFCIIRFGEADQARCHARVTGRQF